MIVTVTPNPSLDRTVQVGELVVGRVHRAAGVRLDPGGKGVNVARALVGADRAAVALLPSGGSEGATLAELLDSEGVPVAEVPIASPTRSNVTVVQADGVTTKFNERGPLLRDTEAAALQSRAVELARDADWLVTCGSLPPGCAPELHADLVRSARSAGAKVAVDASGPALAAACKAGPDLVKPNLAELVELAERPLQRLGDVLDVAHEVRGMGVGTVLVSLGRHGALLVDDGGAWHATGPATPVRSTVGAGDAMVAGYLGAGADGPRALRTAVAYGAAAVGLAGSRMPLPEDLRTSSVRVDEVDTSLSLSGAAV
ncbi:1-phosphofructokinase [Parasphingorhabdus pacifica]